MYNALRRPLKIKRNRIEIKNMMIIKVKRISSIGLKNVIIKRRSVNPNKIHIKKNKNRQ